MIDLHNGDCLEVMKSIPDGSVDMILTDPPYGTTACKWDTVIPFEPMWEQINRIIKPKGCIALFGSEPFSSLLRCSNLKNYKYDWVWEKDKPSNFSQANKRPMLYHENICVFYKSVPTYNKQMIPRTGSGEKRYKYIVDNSKRQSEHITLKNKPKFYDPKLKNPSTILKVSTGRRQNLQHPTQKPVALLEYLIKTYTNENETVLDFTMGSGSTMIACLNINRKGIGIELDKHYFDVATKRINEHKATLEVVV